MAVTGSTALKVNLPHGLSLFVTLNLEFASVFAVAAALSPLGYALYTDHIWEDFFITFRHSENLARGDGLVYQPGERVHGFTSPLGVLLPAGAGVPAAVGAAVGAALAGASRRIPFRIAPRYDSFPRRFAGARISFG